MAELWSPPDVKGLWDFFRRGALMPYCVPRRVTATTTLLSTDRVLIVDTTGGAITVNLPAASSVPINAYRVKLIAGANNVTLDANGTESIYTTGAVGTLAWNTAGTSYTIVPCLITAPSTWGWVVA